MAWDSEGLSRAYLARAERAALYLEETKRKSKQKRSYEHIYDMTLAEFYVYNYLHGKIFLKSRASLLQELERYLSGEERIKAGADAFERERFIQYWRKQVEQLIHEFESPPSG